MQPSTSIYTSAILAMPHSWPCHTQLDGIHCLPSRPLKIVCNYLSSTHNTNSCGCCSVPFLCAHTGEVINSDYVQDCRAAPNTLCTPQLVLSWGTTPSRALLQHTHPHKAVTQSMVLLQRLHRVCPFPGPCPTPTQAWSYVSRSPAQSDSGLRCPSTPGPARGPHSPSSKPRRSSAQAKRHNLG